MVQITEQCQTIIWTNDSLVLQRIFASLDHSESVSSRSMGILSVVILWLPSSKLPSFFKAHCGDGLVATQTHLVSIGGIAIAPLWHEIDILKHKTVGDMWEEYRRFLKQYWSQSRRTGHVFPRQEKLVFLTNCVKGKAKCSLFLFRHLWYNCDKIEEAKWRKHASVN